jgi:PII-like signaling protein
MFALFIVLNEVDYLPEILKKMREIGLKGATIIESFGSATVADNDMYTDSFLLSLVNTLEGRKKASRVIFSLIEREDQVNNAMNEVQNILGGEIKGMMFVLPVEHMRGGELGRLIEKRRQKENASGE